MNIRPAGIRASILTKSAFATALLCGMALAAPAQADTVFSLENVQFDDGGTADGTFSLNVSNFLSGSNIVTTTGVTGAPPIAGIDYDPAFQTLHSPASTVFTFESAGFAWNLVLEFSTLLDNTTSGPVALVAGGGTAGNYTGSYEECVSSTVACGGYPFETVRFVTAGDATAPEPASIAILGFALMGVFGARRYARRQA